MTYTRGNSKPQHHAPCNDVCDAQSLFFDAQFDTMLHPEYAYFIVLPDLYMFLISPLLNNNTSLYPLYEVSIPILLILM